MLKKEIAKNGKPCKRKRKTSRHSHPRIGESRECQKREEDEANRVFVFCLTEKEV